MSIDESLARVLARWRAQGAVLLPARDAADVQRSFGRLGLSATEDVVRMFALFGGLDEMDDDCWEFWSLEKLVERNLEHPRPGVLFGDYLIDCTFLLLRPLDASTSDVWLDGFDPESPKPVAPSLDAFFRSYLADPDFVFGAPRR